MNGLSGTKNSFSARWNSHYDFSNPANLKEIEAAESYDLYSDKAEYKAGQSVISPWGLNEIIEARHDAGEDTCIKLITINAGNMLSLQRHRARKEVWDVLQGELTAILDGVRHDVPAGGSLFIAEGAVHCMINLSATPVVVRETQTGICREKDNIRLLDGNGRPTYPLTSETEYQSAELYRQIEGQLKR